LHRSEGFGFSLAEAMAYEKPVIGTGYSGNLTFMNDENSYLVGFGLTPIPPGIPNYPTGALWADPDLDEAATAMRRVVERPDEVRERGRRGRGTIETWHSLERTAEFARSRVAEIATLSPKAGRRDSDVERAARFLALGPSLSWTSPSGRFGRLGVLARRALMRVLKPYLVRHREWESLVVEALRRQEGQAKGQAERIEQLEATVNRLAAQVDRERLER
jgi:hypothetical protein